MTAPTPNALRELVDQARDLLDHDPMCPLPTTTDHPAHVNACGYPSTHTGQINPMCLTCLFRWARDVTNYKRTREDVKVLAGSPGDPTGEFALTRLEDDKGRQRRIERQLEGVARAVTDVIAQERILTKLIERFTGKSGREEHYPPGSMLSKAEMAESWEAKRRREDRGGGFGSG